MTEQTAATTPESTPLTLDVEAVKKEIVVAPAEQVNPELDQQANDVVARLVALNADDPKTIEAAKSAVETMGLKVQMEAAKKSDMLKQPIANLAKAGEDGGPVAKSLVDLKMQVEELDPARFDFTPGFLSRTVGFLPFIGKPIKRYFTKYEAAGTVVDSIMGSLRIGREQLKRDNITLTDDQAELRQIGQSLQQTIEKARLIDGKLSDKLSTEIPSDDPTHKFLQEEIVFPLRQRIEDLQQGVLVTQQGVLTMELIVRNNKELMRGVDRALFVTNHALQIAVASALALANQKIVIDKLQAVNETTDNLLLNNSERLATQGVEINKMASSTQLSIDNLKQCFANVNGAIEEISKFRIEALPKMAQAIVEMNDMAVKQEESISKMEEGNKMATDFMFDVE